MLAVVDTNVWVSAVFTPGSFAAEVVRGLAGRRFEALFCDETLLELKDAVTSPRNVRKYGWRISDLNALIRIVVANGREVSFPAHIPAVCRDRDDDLFIALAVQGQADYLVTRDDDLKGAPEVREYLTGFGVQVVSVREFVASLDSPEA